MGVKPPEGVVSEPIAARGSVAVGVWWLSGGQAGRLAAVWQCSRAYCHHLCLSYKPRRVGGGWYATGAAGWASQIGPYCFLAALWRSVLVFFFSSFLSLFLLHVCGGERGMAVSRVWGTRKVMRETEIGFKSRQLKQTRTFLHFEGWYVRSLVLRFSDRRWGFPHRSSAI